MLLRKRKGARAIDISILMVLDARGINIKTMGVWLSFYCVRVSVRRYWNAFCS